MKEKRSGKDERENIVFAYFATLYCRLFAADTNTNSSRK
jgi:hypothetical protein